MAFDPAPFRCDVLPADDGRVVLRPVGELDIATGPVVDEQLRRARAAGHDRLVLDLREVAFLDSTGLRLILAWNELSANGGCSFALLRGPELVQRVFDATRVTDRLTFEDPDDGDLRYGAVRPCAAPRSSPPSGPPRATRRPSSG